MLLEEIKPSVFKTNKKIKDLIKKYGIPSKEVLMALHKGKKSVAEYDVVKTSRLEEMTLSGASSQSDIKMKSYFDFISQNGEIIGHQGNKDIIKIEHQGTSFFGIKDNDILICIASFKKTKDPNIWELGFVHTLSEFKGKGDIFRLLWFIKDQEGKSIIDYGVQTSDGQRLTKALAKTKRFNIKWFNTETNETKPYNPESDSIDNKPFRSESEITNWKIMIEQSETPAFPRFRKSMLPENYHTPTFKASINEIYEIFDTETNYDI